MTHGLANKDWLVPHMLSAVRFASRVTVSYTCCVVEFTFRTTCEDSASPTARMRSPSLYTTGPGSHPTTPASAAQVGLL